MGVELKELGYRNTLLRVSMAFHSPIMECIHDELEEFIAGIEFHPPQNPGDFKHHDAGVPSGQHRDQEHRDGSSRIAGALDAERSNSLERLWGAAICGGRTKGYSEQFVSDCIEEAECVQTCLPSAEPSVYRTALAQLFATGNLPARGPVRFVSFTR